MRKHDVRKWLHAILDLLPVILIPVFMIYSHRHTIDSGSIDVPQNQVVDFNQHVKNGNFDNEQYWSLYNATATFTDNNALLLTNDGAEYGVLFQDLGGIKNDIYYIKINFLEMEGFVQVYYEDFVSSVNSTGTFEHLFTYTSDNLVGRLGIYSFNGDKLIDYIEVINFTQMFGSGNEPTIQQFNQLYSNEYYDYTLSHKELLKGTSTITYDDTDIMSQVVYQLYNSVDKYFNMGNVFNMTGVYDWFNLNIFNGNAPISIYIVWNIVLYEFVMDLLFLLYGLFMWFIDMVEKLMEKPLKSVK